MPSTRRWFLRATGPFLPMILAGCVGDTSGGNPTDGPASGASSEIQTTPSEPEGSSHHAESPTPAPTAIEGVSVPPCPERPDRLAHGSILKFASQFEESYMIRRTLRQSTGDIVSIRVDPQMDPADTEVTQAHDGWLVRFFVIGPAYRYRPAGSTETRHVDPPAYQVHYFINDETVLRASDLEAVDPREVGSHVHCP